MGKANREVIVHDDGGWLWAEVEDLPGCFASGRTRQELDEALDEAMAQYTTTEQVEQLFDRRVRKYLCMSGEEFRALVSSGGELPDHPMVGHLLLMLGSRAR